MRACDLFDKLEAARLVGIAKREKDRLREEAEENEKDAVPQAAQRMWTSPLRLRKLELDKANKDKKNKLCRAEFAVELTFGRAEEDLGAEESARQRNELTRSLSKADGAALFEDGTAELADDADVGDEEGEEGEEGEEDAD